MADGSSSQLPDGTWDPAAGTIYVWYDALINYVTGAGFPDDPAAFEHWWPADLHVIGKDIARFHTIFWPAMLWSAGLEAPRHVWIHGWLLAQGERMSKSLGNFLDPLDVVRTLGADGARYVTLREVPFDRDADVSWDSFVRRYNADLANNFGNLLNRTVSMVNRYFDGERQALTRGGLSRKWEETLPAYVEKLGACQLSDALAVLWDFVDAANQFVDAVQPWTLAKAMKAGDEEAGAGLRAALGDLVEGVPAGRAGGGAVRSGGGAAGSRPARLRLPLRGRRQRRPAAPRRAGLGRPLRPGGQGRDGRAALPAHRGPGRDTGRGLIPGRPARA